MRRVLSAVDRLLDHRWLTRISNLWFVWTSAVALAGILRGLTGSFTTASLVFLGTGGTLLAVSMAVGSRELRQGKRALFGRVPPMPDWRSGIVSPRQYRQLLALTKEREGYEARLKAGHDRLARSDLRDRIRAVDTEIVSVRDHWWDRNEARSGFHPDLADFISEGERMKREMLDAFGFRERVDANVLRSYRNRLEGWRDRVVAFLTSARPDLANRFHALALHGLDSENVRLYLEPRLAELNEIQRSVSDPWAAPDDSRVALSGEQRDALRRWIAEGEALEQGRPDTDSFGSWAARAADWLVEQGQGRVARDLRAELQPTSFGEARSRHTDRLRKLRVLLIQHIPSGISLDHTPLEALDRYMEVEAIPDEERKALRQLTERLLGEAERSSLG